MTNDEVDSIPTGALVEFEVPDDDETWQGWLASRPFGVICEGATDPHHGCFVLHTEPIAFDCVDIQITSTDWPYEEPHPEYGTESALVPISNVLRVLDMYPPETQPEWYA